MLIVLLLRGWCAPVGCCQLRIEHRDLDDVIHRLQLDLYVDQVQMRRLKKRKLMLKDQIARLESQLIPDLNA